jgi:uncharacterized protein
MKTFDAIQVRRPDLALSYLELLKAQPGRPIALFAPRRVGKTFFLDHDLRPAAAKNGMLPVYADLWLHREQPLMAINHALEEALDDETVPAGRVGKIAGTPVRKIGALGASLDLGEEPTRRKLPEEPALRMDALVLRLARQSGKPVLLMLDEIQSLAESSASESAIAALRAVLQNRKKQVLAVFTGSSQEAMSRMMLSAGGPMYQFAQLLTFPFLDSAYLKMLADHFRKVHPNKALDMAALERLFTHVHYKPALMKDIVKFMSSEGMTDVDIGLQKYLEDERNVPAWQGVFEHLPPLDQAVLFALAHGIAPMGRDSLAAFGRITGGNVTIAKVRAALERMQKNGILTKSLTEGYLIEDRLFRDYLAMTQTARFTGKGKLLLTAKDLPR